MHAQIEINFENEIGDELLSSSLNEFGNAITYQKGLEILGQDQSLIDSVIYAYDGSQMTFIVYKESNDTILIQTQVKPRSTDLSKLKNQIASIVQKMNKSIKETKIKGQVVSENEIIFIFSKLSFLDHIYELLKEKWLDKLPPLIIVPVSIGLLTKLIDSYAMFPWIPILSGFIGYSTWLLITIFQEFRSWKGNRFKYKENL